MQTKTTLTEYPLPYPIQGVILDMDGVIWRGDELLVDLPEIVEKISSLGIRTLFLTNNSTKSQSEYLEKFRKLGVSLEPWQILTSSMAAGIYLSKHYAYGSGIYTIGEDGLKRHLLEKGFRLTQEEAAVVVVGLDRKITYEKLKIATRLIRAGATFIGTNPDKTLPTPDGQVPGAGSIIAAIEAATDTSPIIIGKPNATIILLALEILDLPQTVTLVVGDRLETDILGGQRAGCYSALVLSGVTTSAEAARWSPAPTFICPDLTNLVDMLSLDVRK